MKKELFTAEKEDFSPKKKNYTPKRKKILLILGKKEILILKKGKINHEKQQHPQPHNEKEIEKV